jgi:hypothetical protein
VFTALPFASATLSTGPAHAALGGTSGIVIPYAGNLALNGALVSSSTDFRFDAMRDSSQRRRHGE